MSQMKTQFITWGLLFKFDGTIKNRTQYIGLIQNRGIIISLNGICSRHQHQWFQRKIYEINFLVKIRLICIFTPKICKMHYVSKSFAPYLIRFIKRKLLYKSQLISWKICLYCDLFIVTTAMLEVWCDD